MKLSPSQLRAARALLNWSRAELAKRSGISEPTLHRFENGANVPESRTSEKLAQILIAEGIELTDNHGVRFKPEGVEVLNGREGVQKFWDAAYATAQITNHFFRQISINDATFIQCAPDIVKMHIQRMNELRQIKKRTLVRVLMLDGDQNALCPIYAEYRWWPKNMPTPIPYYIFGDNVGIFAFNADPSPKIILISSPTIAATYAKQFDEIWRISKPVPLAKHKS